MKPTPSDLWLWEAVQSRDVPSWAHALDAKRAASALPPPSRDARIAQLLHGALNARDNPRRVGDKPRPFAPKLDQRNAVSLMRGTRRLIGVLPNPEYRSLRAWLAWAIEQRGTGYDQRRAYWRRWLRRLNK